MRHNKGFNHLGRTSAHRKAMLANMATSLIMHKRITTTTAKAKALRGYVEPLITKSKEDSTNSRRVVFSYLRNKYAVSELFREISPKIAERPGGYTRILKLGNRLGDNADMCIIELVDYNENMLSDGAGKAKATRRRRGSKKKEEAVTAPATAAKTPAAKVAVEEAVVIAPEVAEEAEVIAPEVTEEAVADVVVENEEVAPETEATADDTAAEADETEKKEA